MHSNYTKKLVLLIKRTDIGAQRIGNTVENFWVSHSKLLAPKQAKNLFVSGFGNAIPYSRKCRPTVYRKKLIWMTYMATDD